jgi:hypothetical protein
VISGSKKALTAGSKIKFGQSTRDYFVSFSEGDGSSFETPSMRGETKGLIMTDHGMKRSRWVDEEEEEEERAKMRKSEDERAGVREKPTPVPKVRTSIFFAHSRVRRAVMHLQERLDALLKKSLRAQGKTDIIKKAGR